MSEIFFFAKALAATLGITAAGFVLGFLILGIACLAAIASRRFRKIFLVCCQFFQTIPFLILLFWIYFGWGYLAQHFFGFALSPFVAGLTALGISFVCFAGEALVHALENIGVGIFRAAQSLNIKGWALYRYIVLPEIWSHIGGLVANLLLILMKESALVSALGVFELTRASQVYSEFRGDYFSGALISLFIYWALAEFLQRGLLRRAVHHA